MNLRDLAESRACPSCFDGSRSYHWSGAGIEPAAILAGGCAVLDRTDDEYGWPATARARCARCGAVWDFEFRWVDRPPLLLLARRVDET